MKCINEERRRKAPYRKLKGKSSDATVLEQHPEMALDFIIAPPRMKLYMTYSDKIFSIYLRYIAPEVVEMRSLGNCTITSTQNGSGYQPIN